VYGNDDDYDGDNDSDNDSDNDRGNDDGDEGTHRGQRMKTELCRLRPKVAVGALASPLEVGADRAPQAAAELAALLGTAGCEVVPLGPITTADAATAAGQRLAATGVDALALAPASWFEDYLVLDLLEECPLPVCLWPLPGMETGALCGTQQLTCYLRYLGTPFEAVFGTLEAGATLERALAFLGAAALQRRLRRARIGLAGQRVRGMTEVAVHEMGLKRTIGPRVVTVDLVGLLQRAQSADSAAAARVWREVCAAAGKVSVPEQAGKEAAGVYLAVREVIRQEGLAALAFGCYPDFMGCACLAASLLADEGIPVGCEGDVNTAVGQLMLTWLTGEATHNTDWLDPLPDGSVVFTHCGSGSYRLAERRQDITLAPVRLANRGVCSLFPARPGPVTLLSLLPVGSGSGAGGSAPAADGYQVALLEGEAVPTEMVFPGNPLRVRFAAPVSDIIQWIFAQGIGHHWAAGYGHVGAELRAWARIAGSAVRWVEI
jgi:L-fucose isomerase-like protein